MRTRSVALALAGIGVLCGCTADVATTGPAGSETTRAAVTTAEIAAVGRAIFFDEDLSLNRNQSCATCHAPEVGWTGPAAAVNAGGAVYEGSVTGRFGNRKPPSSAYATSSPVFGMDPEDPTLFEGGNFWDGRATGEKLGNPAADQAQGPFLNPVEQALPSAAEVVARVCAAGYGAAFRAAWGDAICGASSVDAAYDAIARSIARFEASAEVNAFSSKFDAWRGGRARFTPEERLGFALFTGKAKCAGCHVLDERSADNRGRTSTHGSEEPTHALFTDFTFDNLGIPSNPENPWYASPLNSAGADWIDEGLGAFLRTRPEWSAYAQANLGKHKVPTLRNVDRRPSTEFVKAYGHNGYFKSLEGIVHFYNTRDVKPACAAAYTEAQALAAGCWPAPEEPLNVNRSELGNLHLTVQQERALVAFMRTLSDGYAR